MPVNLQDLTKEALNHRLLALIILCLCVLAADFVGRFFIPAVRLLRSLKRITRFLNSQKLLRAQQSPADLPRVLREAAIEEVFFRPWHEYSKTLHAQRGTDEHGQNRVLQWRATALAETFFTERALVDSPLRTEYFKHLPGILTGLGIIGTFRGLIQGLRNFLPSIDPGKMQGDLSTLIRVVGDAFLTSAASIVLAMLFTLVEKLLLNMCYRRVELIQYSIDRLFHAGAGEEYLERLCIASDISATQAIHIKDALVSDLRQIMAEVTTRQVEASARDSKAVSTQVAEVIVQRLSGPIETMSEAVRHVGSNQADAVHTMLADVLVRFSEQIHTAFGGQMTGIGELLGQTMKGMQQTAHGLEQLAASMDAAGKNTTAAMTDQLDGALSSMGARQQLLNRQNAESIEQIKGLISLSRTENAETLKQIVAQLGQQVIGVVGELHDQSRLSIERQREEGTRFAVEIVGGLTREIENLLRQSSETSRSLVGSMDALTGATNDSISRMAAGAELLHVASSDFARAGQTVIAAVSGTSAAIDRIQAATQSLAAAMNGTVEVLDEYKKNRDTFAMMVADLKATLDKAKKEAFMTSDLVEKLERAAAQLANAERQSEDYLKKINEVLARTHEAFAENMARTLSHGNSHFHLEMAKAVDLLAGGVRGLENVLEMAPLRG